MKNLKLIKIFIIVIVFSLNIACLIKVSGQSNDYDAECDMIFFSDMMNCVNGREAEKCQEIRMGKDCACSGIVSDPAVTACARGCDNKYNECNIERGRIYDEYNKCGKNRDDLLDSCGNNCDKVFNSFRSCISDIGGACKILWTCDNNSDNSGKNKSSNDDSLSDGVNDNLDKSLVGLPVDLKINTSPCVGKTPKNSELCLGDDEKVFYYTQKELVESCSVPDGSEPKCEYVCKGGYNLVDGECESAGFFAKILNWLGKLF